VAAASSEGAVSSGEAGQASGSGQPVEELSLEDLAGKPIPTNQNKLLMKLAMAGSHHTVEGRVRDAATSGSGKVFRIRFQGNEKFRDFVCVYFPPAFPAMEAKFGGQNGANLTGKVIQVTGELSTYRGQPQIIISDASQVEVVGPPEAVEALRQARESGELTGDPSVAGDATGQQDAADNGDAATETERAEESAQAEALGDPTD